MLVLFRENVLTFHVSHRLIIYGLYYTELCSLYGFPGGLVVKNLPLMQEHWFDPWVGNFPCRRNGNLFQYTCQDNPMDKGTWQATVHRVAKTWTWLSDWACTHACYIPTFWRVFIINGCYYYCSVAKFCLDSVTPWMQHARLPCPSPSLEVCCNSCPLSQWGVLNFVKSFFWIHWHDHMAFRL